MSWNVLIAGIALLLVVVGYALHTDRVEGRHGGKFQVVGVYG